MLRHYKYTWAAGRHGLLLVIALPFGDEVNGARLWIYLGPVGVQPGEFIKIILVVFIAGYLAEQPRPAERGERAHRSDPHPAPAVPAAHARLFVLRHAHRGPPATTSARRSSCSASS